MGKVRISAANLVRVELDERILIVLNRSRLKAGKREYSPFGGVLEFYDPARPFLESLDAKFEGGNDLRLSIREDGLPEFEQWFYQKADRETSPYRELKEELVDEERVLPNLLESRISVEYLWTTKRRKPTDKPGYEGVDTVNLFEIYRATLDGSYEQQVRTALTDPQTHLGLVTEREISALVSASGISIASNCKPLILRS